MIKAYPFPEGLDFNKEYNVILKDTATKKEYPIKCYNAPVCNTCIETGKAHNGPESLHRDNMAFAIFESDFSSPVEVVVTNNVSLSKSVSIRPMSYDVKYSKQGNTVSFLIDRPIKLSIEFDGDKYHNLFLYAEAPETDVPDKNEENVIYFDSGIHDIGKITLKSNQTMYLAPGAYVYGHIKTEDAENIKICGRGVLSGAKMPHDMKAERPPQIAFIKTDNITLKDIIMIDCSGWTSAFFWCNSVHVKNLKQITNYFNGDGLDICSCTDFLAEDLFIRNFDDSISIKSKGTDCKNITIKNSVLWNDCAHSMLVGPESPPEAASIFESILFENIVVLESQEHNPTFMGVLSMMCTDNATFRNITWKNIDVENMIYGRLVCVRYQTAYGTDIGKSIENILIENLRYTGPITQKSIIAGTNSEHTVDNFLFKNCVINGRHQTNGNIFFDTNEFADVKFL